MSALGQRANQRCRQDKIAEMVQANEKNLHGEPYLRSGTNGYL
jgi:hypothetical protein